MTTLLHPTHKAMVTAEYVASAAPLLRIVTGLDRRAFDRYDNPFEQRWTLREKWANAEIHRCFNWLETPVRQAIQKHYEYQLFPDVDRHYAGVFQYAEGDYLQAHVDAGVYPQNPSLHKAVTVLYYLTPAELTLWTGDDCADDEPAVYAGGTFTVHLKPGDLFWFENNDRAWHSVPPVAHGASDRWVVTASYFTTAPDFHRNQRTRDYFVPHPGEQWDDEKRHLRDRRASWFAPTVYRAGTTAESVIECLKCDGCGKVANDEEQTPWKYWIDLPVHSAAAILSGVVRPLECPACNGKGTIAG